VHTVAPFHFRFQFDGVGRQDISSLIADGNIKASQVRGLYTSVPQLSHLHLYRIAFRSDVKKHLSIPLGNAIFRGIIATERCCFARLLKVVHSAADRCFAPRRKANAMPWCIKRNLRWQDVTSVRYREKIDLV
jgi:hypothetical protein